MLDFLHMVGQVMISLMEHDMALQYVTPSEITWHYSDNSAAVHVHISS